MNNNEETNGLLEKQKKLLIEKHIIGISKQYHEFFTKDDVKKAIDMFIDRNDSLDKIYENIDELAFEFIERKREQQNFVKSLDNKFKDKDSNYQNVNIENIDISKLSSNELENKFFHFASKNFLEIFDTEGMKAVIGENSDGIDDEKSIFFSKGTEGVLELWDVWLKWRLNRLNNPMYQGDTKEERDANLERYTNGDITPDEKNNLNDWMYYFSNKKFINDEIILNKLFEYQYAEMSKSNYFILNLKENEEFTYNQKDSKKVEAILNAKKRGYLNPMTTVQYGDYSDFSTTVADKWNMQTIPGKDVLVEPDRLKKLTINGKDDVYSIVKFLYDKYNNETKESKVKPVKFDLLDKYISYIDKKKKDMNNTNKTESQKDENIKVNNNQKIKVAGSPTQTTTNTFHTSDNKSKTDLNNMLDSLQCTNENKNIEKNNTSKPKVLSKSPSSSDNSKGFISKNFLIILIFIILLILFIIIFCM